MKCTWLLGFLALFVGCRSTSDEGVVYSVASSASVSLQDPDAKKAKGEGHPANEGIEEDGTIEHGELPEVAQNSDSWRFVPEGRLIEGSALDRLMVSTFIFPIFFYEEALGAGLGLNYTDLNFGGSRRKRMLNIATTYSSEGQQRVAIFVRDRPEHYEVDGGGIVYEEKSSNTYFTGYGRTPTRRFYGLGSKTASSAETSYADMRLSAATTIKRSIPVAGDPLVYDLGIVTEYRDLGAGQASGSPSTHTVFPVLFASGDTYGALWIKGGLSYNALDSPANPYHGFSLGADVKYAPLQSDSNTGGIVDVKGEWAHEVWSPFHDGGSPTEENPPTDTFAIGAFLKSTWGDLPFWALPTLGGSRTQRGYIANRFTDNAAWHASAEYRFWPISRGVRVSEAFRIERLGAALFYDVGTVATRMGRFDGADVKQSYGVSLRMALERTTLFRIDFGFSDESQQIAVAFGLPF
jgi:outer membrane protein assembly factor BamA